MFQQLHIQVPQAPIKQKPGSIKQYVYIVWREKPNKIQQLDVYY